MPLLIHRFMSRDINATLQGRIRTFVRQPRECSPRCQIRVRSRHRARLRDAGGKPAIEGLAETMGEPLPLKTGPPAPDMPTPVAAS
jgi:hypothetical protein